MTVEVRLFAALRDAAGTARTTSEAATVGALLDELSVRYGEPFASRSRRATVVLGEDPVTDPATPLADGACVVLLPPFSGGS